MHAFDRTTLESLTRSVQEAEERSGVEIVVRVVPRCAEYPATPWICAAIGGLMSLAVVLFAPPVFLPAWVIPLVLAGGFFGWTVGASVRGLTRLTRWLTLPSERREALERAANAAFHTEAVAATRDGTGVLVFAGQLEDRIRVLPDYPLQGRIDQASWHAVEEVGEGPLAARLQSVIEAIGALSLHVAPRRSADANELPDAPRVGPA